MARSITSLALLALFAAGCQSTPAPSPAAQAIVDNIASLNSDIIRLTVHAAPPEGGDLCAIASTSDAKRGKPSDPEDLRAIQNGETVVLDEGDAIDVTVPILKKDGAFTAAAGVTMKGGADRDAIVAAAKGIAGQIEAAMPK